MSYWQEKVVLITGGAAGLGKKLSTHFGAAGAQLVLADRNESLLRETTDTLAAQGIRVRDIATDITNQDSVDALFQRVDQWHGRLNALVNCAGRSGRGAVLETDAATFQAFLDLNFFGTMRCTRAAVPRLLKTKGHLVNIGSLAAKMASSFISAYPVSKFAVAAYSHQIRLEHGAQGLHVLLVCPGPIAREDAGRRYADAAGDVPDSARKPGGGVRIKGIDPDYLATKIMRACEKRKLELVIPARARLLAAILQLWPSLGDRIIRKMTS